VRVACAAYLALAACRTPPPRVEPIATPAEGIAIMVYAKGETSYGVVDDRRWIDVTGNSVTLDRIDSGAALPSLVIEPVGAGDLHVGACMRERIDTTAEGLQRLAQVRADTSKKVRAGDDEPPVTNPGAPYAPDPVGLLSPLVRCAVTGAHGRHLVRVLYVAPAIRYRAQHDITMRSESRASIVTRFALSTPAWGKPGAATRAEVSLFDGLPGSDEPPREVAHGTVVLDGGTAVLTIPERVAGAKLRRVFDGAVRDRNVARTDVAWGKDSRSQVWVWLELDDPKLSSGMVRALIDFAGEPARDSIVPAARRERRGTTMRLPLWVDDTLHGMRRRWIDRADAGTLAERFQLSVSNAGDVPREVWIEERLRPAKHRELSRAWPAEPTLGDDFARSKVTVPPHASEQIGFLLTYEL